MKKTICIILLLVLLTLLASCAKGDSTYRQTIEVAYQASFAIEQAPFEGKTNIVWETKDESIAVFEDGKINGLLPGETDITALENGNVIAVYTVKVTTIPVTTIVLSTNSCELVQGKSLRLSYILFPENASDYGLVWKSANSAVASVSESGKVTAKRPGQTTISLSTPEGVVATCSIEVVMKPAYDRLSSAEKEFVDTLLKNINQFKNPSSVVVKKISETGGCWEVEIQAQNGFGGNGISGYTLYSFGFVEKEYYYFSHDSKYDLDLINQAIDEKR